MMRGNGRWLRRQLWFAAALMLSTAAAADPIYRSIDGYGTNPAHPEWGSAGSQLLRNGVPAVYPDGWSMPSGLPSTRAVSNAVAAQPGPIFNTSGATDFIWQWGQFLDHDMDLTRTNGIEFNSIPIPPGDPHFTSPIPFTRSAFDPTTGTASGNPRQQVNVLTAFIDASQVYGSDAATATALRSFSGGAMKVTSTAVGDLLPTVSTPMGDMFVAGDERVNEQIALTAMHTLFVREHNRLAAEFAASSPQTAGETDAEFDERIYQTARKVVGAEMQAITYNEFLPMLLGKGALPDYAGYDQTVNPGIANIFSAAAFRLGHTLLSPSLMRLDENGNVIPAGNLPLRDAFFKPAEIVDNGGIEPILRGLSTQIAQEIDPFIVDDVRNFLFGPPGAGGFDLAALNMQRGRDHGIPGYNAVRGLVLGVDEMFTGWDDPDLNFLPGVKEAMMSVYASIDDIDLWIGGLSEVHVNGGMLGELFSAILIDQFERLRSGDRFFYLSDGMFEDFWLDMIQNSTLSAIVMRNTTIGSMRYNAFSSIPEPSTLMALLAGLAVLRGMRRMRAM